MTALREKVTISLYYDELITIEKLKKQLSDDGLLVAPSTSEIVRLALHVLAEAPHSKLRNAVAVVPDRRAGRPKG
jgi:uncharacterized protein YwlG (UPF0340 family)